jgi:serine/threonine protein kinase
MKPLAQNSLIQNRYLIVQLIGKGGMGEVYLAVDQRLGSAVALKRTYFADDETLGNAFEREARTLARMRHPVLPKVSDHFGEGEEQYLVMEHISGEDLSKRIEAAQKPFPISWVLFWADQLLDALSYLHSHEPPIIHRDIKPQNLKLTDENNIILLDFGLSKTSTGMTNISQSGSTGSVVGYTPHYAPMEQIRGIGTSARSDLYSLSATLYQLLTNTIPPDALSRADSMLNGSPDPVRPLNELNPEVSKGVSDVILKGMEVSQEKRFADAREMQKVLRRAFSEMQEVISAVPAASQPNQPSEIIEPVHETKGGDISVPRTVVDHKSMPMPGGEPSNDIDLDATIANVNSDVPEPRQSEVKTEIYQGGIAGISTPSDGVGAGKAGKSEATEAETSHDSKFERQPDQPAVASNGREFNSVETVISAKPAQMVPTSAPAQKSGGNSGLLLGGLTALLLLTAIAAVAGWFVYSNYYSGKAVAEPAPSPAPTFTPAPSPEPTIGAVFDPDVNANTQSAGIDSNVATDESQRPVTAAPQSAPDAPVRAPQTNPSGGNPASNRPKQASPSAPKTTPKPKAPNDRTVILQ